MLEITHLFVNYGQRRVLCDVSLQVGRGEVLALIGPNGAGKSTLLRTISGILRPEAGTIFLGERDLGRLSPEQRARWMAVVPQAHRLPAGFSVRQTVLMGRTPYLGWLGRPASADLRRVQAALELTDLLELAERPVDQLSGGEQQRVLLARALAQDTPVLLLDEPTAHLDLHHQATLLELVHRLAGQQKLTVVMALHDLNLAALYTDRVALLVDGSLQGVGSPAEVLTASRLSQVYRLPIHVITHPDYGVPLILPEGVKRRLPDPLPR